MVETAFSTKELARALNISPGSTTRRRREITERTARMVAAAAPALAPSGRSQCLRRAVRELMASWAAIWNYDPARAEALLHDIIADAIGEAT